MANIFTNLFGKKENRQPLSNTTLLLTITLYAMKVSSTAVKAYKAIVIIIIVVAGSPVVKAWLKQLKNMIVEKTSAKAVSVEAR